MTEITSVAMLESEINTEVENNNEVKIIPKSKALKNILGVMLYIFLLAGIGVGAYFSINGGSQLYKQLDFLFASNINQKLHQDFVDTFLSSYTSNCIFLITAFLLGSSLWGNVLQFAISFFRGFGIGISAAYLFYTYRLNGAIYYAGVMLPCVFVSVVSLIMLQKESFVFSGRLLEAVYKKDEMSHILLHSRFNTYFKKLLLAMIITLTASILDVALTFIFGSSFHF